MQLRQQRFADVLVLAHSGKVDHNNADGFRDALLAHVGSPNADYRAIILNMSDVKYMSSVGLRALMLAAKKSKAVGRPVVVAELNESMQEIFQISRFHLIFDVYDDVRSAMSELSTDALKQYNTQTACDQG